MGLQQTQISTVNRARKASVSPDHSQDYRRDTKFYDTNFDKALISKANKDSGKNSTESRKYVVDTSSPQQPCNKQTYQDHQGHQTLDDSPDINTSSTYRNHLTSSVEEKYSASRSKRSRRLGRHSSQRPSQAHNRPGRNASDTGEEPVVKTSEIALFMRCKKRFGAPDFKPIPPTPGGWDEVKPSREVAWEKTTEMFAEYSPYFNVKSMNDDELSEKCPWKVVSWETRLQNHPTLGDNHGAATKFKNNDQALTTNVTIQIRPDDTDAQKTTKSSPSPNFINVKGIDPLQPHQPASTYPSVSHLPENNTDISWWSDRTWQPVLPPQNNDQVADRYLKTRPASHNSNSTSFSNSYSPLIWIPPKEESQSLHRDELYKLDKQTRHRQQFSSLSSWDSCSRSTDPQTQNRRSLSYDTGCSQPLQRLWESQQHNWATSHDYPYFGPSSPLWSVDISSTSVWSPKDDLRISSESQPTGLIKANEPLTSERYQDRKCGVSEQTDWTGIEDRFLSILKVVDEDGFRPPVNRQCGRMTENSSDRCRHCGASSHLVFRNCPFIPLLDPKQAWVRVLQACERLDIDLFMESLALYSKSRPDETLQDISGKLCDYGSKLQLLAVERDLPQTATVMDLQGRILCRYVALAVVLEIDDHGKDPLHSLSYLPGFPPTWEQNFLRLADAGFFSDKNQIPICRPCGRTGHWLADCVQSQLAINEGVFTRRHFSNHFDRRSNKHDPNEAYRLYYNMDDYVVVHNT